MTSSGDAPTDPPPDPDPADPTDAELVAAVARDEHGLTAEQRARWRAHYHAIATLIEVSIAEAPSAAEARRRVALVRLELRMNEAAVGLCAASWLPDPDPNPTPNT